MQPAVMPSRRPSVWVIATGVSFLTCAAFAGGLALGLRIGGPQHACHEHYGPQSHRVAWVTAGATMPTLGWQLAAPATPTVWAQSVRDFSSQYSTSNWSAAQVLGAPTVFPQHGDHADAWASQSADGQREYITVDFDHARHIEAATIVETFNPGAVARVIGIAPNGSEVVLFEGNTGFGGTADARMLTLRGACSPLPVAALRVELASHRVPGWNEIDAIGVTACNTR